MLPRTVSHTHISTRWCTGVEPVLQKGYKVYKIKLWFTFGRYHVTHCRRPLSYNYYNTCFLCAQQIGICDNRQKSFFIAVRMTSACLKIRNTNRSLLLPILLPPPSTHLPFWQRPYRPMPSWYIDIKFAAF